MFKVTYYELKKLIRDRRMIALFLLQPIILLTVLGWAASHSPQDIKIALYNQYPNTYSDQIVQDLKNEKKLDVSIYQSKKEVVDEVSQNHVSGSIIIGVQKNNGQISGNIQYINNITIPEVSSQGKLLSLNSAQHSLSEFARLNAQAKIHDQTDQAAQKINNNLNIKVTNLQNSLSKLPLPEKNLTSLTQSTAGIKSIDLTGLNNIKINSSEIKTSEKDNTTKKIKYFDFYASAVVILLVLITCLNVSSTTITQERLDGTFERFFVTPYTKTHMILGKMFAFSGIALGLAVVTVCSLKFIFQVSLGSIWLVLLVGYLSSLVAIAIGMLISSFTHTIAESIQVAILVFFANLLTSRFIFQPETMHPILKYVTAANPFTYAISSMREINLLNLGFYDIWKNLVILFGFLIFFLILAVILLRRKAN